MVWYGQCSTLYGSCKCIILPFIFIYDLLPTYRLLALKYYEAFVSAIWFLQVHGEHLMVMLIALEMDIVYLVRKVMIERSIVSILVIVLVCAF